MKYIKQFEYVVNNDYLRHFTKELGIAPLYHAIKSENALKALKEEKLGGFSIQREWAGGKRYKDDQPEYDTSSFMRGISTSRDIEYCAKWNDIIFVFDQDALKTKYKIVPYNWGYSIGRGYIQGARMKREKEEFVITGHSNSYMINSENEDENDDKNSERFKKMISEPEGYIEPLNKYLLGFFISENFEKYTDEKDKEYFKSHPKYLGIYENQKEKKSFFKKLLKI